MSDVPTSTASGPPVEPDGRPAARGPTANPATGVAGEGGGRDAFFDNAKYLAIVLVACGHSWEPFRHESRAALALYDFVYTFHMPAFILISGYFSRTFDFSPRKVKRLVTGVLVPYLVFETLYALFRKWADHDPGYPINVIDPWFITWFLLALFLWRLTVPVWRNLRGPVAIALVASVLAGITPDMGDAFDIQRVLQFLPFFVLGTTLRPEHFAFLRRRAVRAVAATGLCAALAFAYWAAPLWNYQWLYRRSSGQELGVSTLTAGWMALALFLCSLMLVTCFLACVPKRRMWFTVLGTGTLYGYLLHGFLVKGSAFGDWYDADWIHTPAGMVAVTLIAATTMTVLCSPPVCRAFRIVVEPRLDWLFRQDPAEAARRRLREHQPN